MEPIDTFLRLVNDSRADSDDWWHWTAWIEGTNEELDSVQAVTYLLHPTFTPQRQRVETRSSKFALQASAWGEFLLTADIEFKDGRSSRLEHWLELGHQTRSAGKTGSGRKPRVFLSGSMGDRPLVHALLEGLRGNGVEVETADSLDLGSEWQSDIKGLLRGVDVVVSVFSQPLSRWVATEAFEAQRAGHTVIPVVVGDVDVPSELQGLRRFQIKNLKEIPPGLADSIAGRVKDIITPEE